MNNYNPPCRQNGAMHGNYNLQTSPSVQCREAVSNKCAKSPFPVNTALAMAYVPFQQSGEVYSKEKALMRGTLFPCLDKPFLMGCCKC